MKHLLLFVLLFPLFVSAQKKLDNTIIVDTVRTIKEVKQILFNNGYSVEGNDTSFFVTSAKQMKTASVLRLMFAKGDSTIIIKGQYKLQVELSLFGVPTTNDFEMVENRLDKHNINYEYFAEMNKIAKQLGSKITYLKQ